MRESVRWAVLLVFLVLTLASLLVACNSVVPWRANYDEVHIGLLAPMTGELTADGDAMRRGAQMAVEEINAAGGLSVGDKQYRITLLIEDTQSSPEEAVAAARRLLQEDVVAVIGPSISAIAIPVAEVLDQAHMLMIAPFSSHPETTRNKRYVFRIIATDDVQGRVMAEFAFRDLETQNCAILFQEDDVYSAFLAETFRRTYQSLSDGSVTYESFTAEDPDVSEQLARIQESAAEALFVPVQKHHLPRVVHQARDMGITIPLLGSDTWASMYPEDLDEAYNGSYFSTVWSAALSSERSQAFEAEFAQRYGLAPTVLDVLTYDAFGLLFAAAQDQGSFRPRSVLKGIAVLERYEGVSGRAIYLGRGDPIRDMLIIEIQDGEHIFYKLAEP